MPLEVRHAKSGMNKNLSVPGLAYSQVIQGQTGDCFEKYTFDDKTIGQHRDVCVQCRHNAGGCIALNVEPELYALGAYPY